MKKALVICAAALLFACESPSKSDIDNQNLAQDSLNEELKNTQLLEQALAMQSAEKQARFVWRNPKETLEFFGIKPGMNVLEVLPGDGWYTQILIPYLGKEGQLIGVDYDYSIWPHFSFVTDEFLKERRVWSKTWLNDMAPFVNETSAKVSAYSFDMIDQQESNSVDAALFIRALHNLSRFESKGAYMSKSIEATHRVLKTGGIFGVVQHQTDESKTDEWADGSRGYLKKSTLIQSIEAKGFKFVAESSVNANPADQQGEDDIVWRLPPSYATSNGDDTLKAQYQAIGESNRMTLLFKKL